AIPRPHRSTLFPYTTLFRSGRKARVVQLGSVVRLRSGTVQRIGVGLLCRPVRMAVATRAVGTLMAITVGLHRGTAGRASSGTPRSEEHTSELQSRSDLVCRL